MKREAVAHLKAGFGLSERRACRIAGGGSQDGPLPSAACTGHGAAWAVARAVQPAPTVRLSTARQGIAELCPERGRLFVLPPREGEPSGINRVYRRYREEGLAVRKRKARRKAIGTRAPILVETRPNARWSLDFVHDQFASGQRFRVLKVVDDVNRERLAAIPDTSISGRRVAHELTTLIERRGKPGMIVSDKGTELTSNAILTFAATQRIEWH